MMPPSALDDLKVLDISQGIAGPLCARLLGDFGADVIKIEPPGGERGRRMPPFFQDDPDPEKSLFFLLANLNKRGVVLDLEQPKDAALFRELARTADVIVESFQPGYLASLGLDHATLETDNPGLVMTSITPFGQTGPYNHYKGCEIVTYATSGIMAISGTADREPLKHGGFPGQYESAMNGMLATNVALLSARYDRSWPACRCVDAGGRDLVFGDQPAELQFHRWHPGSAPCGRRFFRASNTMQGWLFRRSGGRQRHLERHREFFWPRRTER